MLKFQWWMASILCGALGAQQVQADVYGGGSTLPQPLYQTQGVLTAGFAAYAGMDRGRDKAAFLINDYGLLVPGSNPRSVHWVASESKLTYAELNAYAFAHQAAWGRLIQVPAAATSIAIAFNKAGSAEVDLSVNTLCGVFSGRITDWSQIFASGRSGFLNVVYPNRSGATELFTRFLNAKCSEAGTFAITTDFASSYSGGLPAGAVAANTSEEIMQLLNAQEGRISFVSPAYAASTLEGLSDATKVARVAGMAPTPANIVDAVASIRAPTQYPNGYPADLANPGNWVPVFAASANYQDPSVVAYPYSGYPILGFTNLIVSQCYADAVQTSQIRAFITRHFRNLANNDIAIRNNRLVPLPAVWKNAVRDTFLNADSALSIGNPNVCNGIGRPL
nr:PstS family phosphate ABC transporter substrate-binding protein [Pseudomonas sp. FFPRI_1]